MLKKEDTKNVILAIILTLIVVVAWQYFINGPMQHRQEEAARQQQIAQQAQQKAQQQSSAAAPAAGASQSTAAPQVVNGVQRQFATRAEAVASSPRVPVDSQRLIGSINLKGGLIDDLSLRGYRETLDPESPNVGLLSPLGSPIKPADHVAVVENHGPYFAAFGWQALPGSDVKVPDINTVWTAKSNEALKAEKPVELSWDNGAGLVFHRTISIDADNQPPGTLDIPRQNRPAGERGAGKPVGGFMFTIKDSVENKGSAPVQLKSYASIARIGTPAVGGYAVLHEGLIGRFSGSQKEITYHSMEEGKPLEFPSSTGWLGFTDKYWANALVPDPTAKFDGSFATNILEGTNTYIANMERPALTVQPGSSAEVSTDLFAGAKEVATLSHYDTTQKLDGLSYLIDWGWLWFITQPLFRLIDILFGLFGNFGLAILGVTVILKGFFFPLANRSYDSMSKMKKVQPQIAEIREQFPDDKMKQQQATMALYKEMKINPLSGCLPMLLQVPVFFALYKVLFVTIEMRQAPFFGWIQDLSAPDPTTIFNLFGLIPWMPTNTWLLLGFWPIVMGITMFLQMQLNPAPPDPVQAQMFRYMPIVFTFMLAHFPAGLVIYYCWNNTLSVLQQSFIMKKNGVKVELWDNLKAIFGRKKKPDPRQADA